jgi:predicted ATP-grasp superfamily ATP-dependent carboligase
MAENEKIAYITRDIERAEGMEPSENYLIVSNGTSNGPVNGSVLLIESSTVLDTAELLEQDKARKFIIDNNASVLVFKNTPRIEAICKMNGWNLLNPPSALAEKIENKITQVEWLGDWAKYLPPHSVSTAKDLKRGSQPLVVQWAHGHTGEGTILVNSQSGLRAIQEKFPERMARAANFVKGLSFTVNIIAAPNKILVGNISYQITGLKPFTDNQFSTVGNDWSVTRIILSESEIGFIESLANKIGEKMRESGWRGLFGIDVIKDEEHKQIYLIEINARQPASTTFESFLQNPRAALGIKEITVFKAHLLALQGKSVNQPLIQINDGAQIIQRVTNNVKNIPADVIGSLRLKGYQVISYQNIEMNSDLLRVQSLSGIMAGHDKLNARGKEIADNLQQ